MQTQSIPMFMAWLDQRKAGLGQQGVDVVVTLPERQTDNNAVHADFDTADSVAQITFWESGDCDMEILGIDNGQLVSWQHGEFNAWNEAEQTMNEFLTKVVAITV